MMITICMDCGFEIKGCRSCHKNCPLCGGQTKRMDYVRYMQIKERQEKNGDDS